ncbi:GSTCD family protein [Megaselia abdita]
MLDILFLEIFSKNGQRFTTINSFLALYVYRYLQKPKSIKLQFINREFPQETSLIPLEQEIESIDHPEDPNVTDLKFPVFLKGSNIFISGTCAVCREIVKSSPESTDLLGFKLSCLLAPAETSIWTRFCELEAVRDFNKILSQRKTTSEIYKIPEMFLRFEGHMKLPVRMHNIYKLAREKANKDKSSKPKGKGKVIIDCNIPKESLEIEHKFSEGISFTIADLILYPLFKLSSLIFPSSFNFDFHFPIVKTWLESIEAFDDQCLYHLESLLDLPSLRNEQTVEEFLLEQPEKRETSNRESNSLYKSDPKRYQPRSRMFTSQSEVEARLEKLAPLGLNHSTDESFDFGDMDQFDWGSIDSDHLEKSSLPEKRLDRKRQQLTNLANAVTSLVNGNGTMKIVDFCSGTGPLGLLLAKKLPNCTIVILENKAISIELARKRAQELKLTNCLFYQTNLDYFEGKFDIGCSLHACGTATDIVIDKCLKVKADFVSCPCCYGSIQPMPHLQYPQSKAIKSVLIQKDFLYLAHTADQAHQEGTKNTKLETIEQGRKCMEIVDTDRRMRAEELGYSVIFTKLQPENCTPKNHLLVGRFCK